MRKKFQFLVRDNSFELYRKLYENFGLIFMLKRFLLKNLAIVTQYRINFYNPFIQKEVGRYFSYLIETYQNSKSGDRSKDFKDKIPIFVMWWQGEDTMPELIKLCITSQRRAFSRDTFSYNIISKENYQEFLELPNFILDKVEQGVISLTHLSDIIRVGLLKEYGGLYLDATFYVSVPISYDLFTYEFYSIKKNNALGLNRRHIPKGQWMASFLFAKPNKVLFNFLWEAFLLYHQSQSILIDFYLIDYLIDLANRELRDVSRDIASYPHSNENVYWLSSHLNDSDSNDDFRTIIRNGDFFKLTWKEELMLEQNGEPTIYATLINSMKRENY